MSLAGLGWVCEVGYFVEVLVGCSERVVVIEG